MTKQEKYTPLENSAFLRDITIGKNKYAEMNPTKLHQIGYLFVTGHRWAEGRLVDLDKTKAKSFDPVHAVSTTHNEAPEENPLFALIPEIPRDQFLKSLSDNAFRSRDDRVTCDQPIREIDDTSSISRMPSNIDVHYLTAAMMMLKHFYLNPDRLFKLDGCDEYVRNIIDRQGDVVRDALNTGFDIIRQRGIEENFAKSSAEFARGLSDLTAFSKKYTEHQNKAYEEDLAHWQNIAAMSPSDRQKAIARLDKLINGSAPPQKGSPAP